MEVVVPWQAPGSFGMNDLDFRWDCRGHPAQDNGERHEQASGVRAAEPDCLRGVMASAAAQAGAGLPGRLAGLLDVPDGSRVSEIERVARGGLTASG
jgi:hypothetical protein